MKHYILLDSSGSMASRWVEVMNSLKSYIDELDPSHLVTVKAFDSSMQTDIRVIAENVTKDNYKFDESVTPRGLTPLFDAMSIAYTEMTEEDLGVIVVITDGLENSSREGTLETVSDLRKKAEERGVQTLFIGANLEDLSNAAALNINGGLSLTVNDGKYEEMARTLAVKTNSYSNTRSAGTLVFSDDEKKSLT